MQRQQLLSALRVLTRQGSLSSQQEVNADHASQMGLANVIVEDSVAHQIHDAVTDYGSTGHAACELVAAGQVVADRMDAYEDVRERLGEEIREGRTAADEPEFRERMAEWSNLVRDADDATVQALLSGDEDAARSFIAVVAGPPRYPVEAGSGSVLSRMDRVTALREEARNAAAVYALADLRREPEPARRARRDVEHLGRRGWRRRRGRPGWRRRRPARCSSMRLGSRRTTSPSPRWSFARG